MTLHRLLAAVIVTLVVLAQADSKAGMNSQGMNSQGMNSQGMNSQGMNSQGMNSQGMNSQGMNSQGISVQGMNSQGMNSQGMNSQGMNSQGMNSQATTLQGMQQRGIDRLRGLGATLTFDRLELAPVQPSRDVQAAPQAASPPITYPAVLTDVLSSPQLQAAPSANPTNTNGNYIYVKGYSGTPKDIAGTFWNFVFHDPELTPFTVPLFIAGVEKDTSFNLSTSPLNNDVWLYTVYFRQPATGQWVSLCPNDKYGKPHAMATPVNLEDWGPDSRKKFQFACTAGGVASKCARIWGYKPWSSAPVDLLPYYRACLVAARADYCQDDHSYTRNGTTVDLFDVRPNLPSINPTVGFPFAPGVQDVMLHEEYQISIDHRVSSVLPPGTVLSANDQTLANKLWQSGLQSSRYPDLDPGRSCPASKFIDRCDPFEPYTCYRAENMRSEPYGAMLAINSPRHCAHSDAVPGDPLDPLCNACTSRVCDVDPTCCGDPGPTYYPRALVWDQQCITIRNQVCRSTPTTAQTWLPGVAADPPDGSLPSFPLGAIGAFDGFITVGTTTYAEGWACDPDFPNASSPILVSVGGELGAAGSAVYTSIADQRLVDGWAQQAASACGGDGRHGFRFQMPAGSANKEVFVYGLDMNVPSAPFSLLRGGKKLLPTAGATPTDPVSAIWTGWVEPSATGTFKFCKRQPGTTTCAPVPGPINPTADDLYRLWVNGAYVGGNWKDDPAVAGGFTLDPPSAIPSVSLQTGVRYPVRIEYQRKTPLATSSEMALLWQVPGGSSWALVPSSALYAAGVPNGKGLRGDYFKGAAAFDSLSGTPTHGPTEGVLDNVWTDGKPDPKSDRTLLPAGISVKDGFGARFTGQIVPAISGDYLFSADTDGQVRITVNGAPAGNGADGPPGFDDKTCSHDICVTGGAISRTCTQGNFCAGRICNVDATCCSITWDARCVEQIPQVCGKTCSPTPPMPVTLQAGWRYDVTVEYLHAGGDAVRAAKLRLLWALPGATRDVVPIQRLYTATGTSAGLGRGMNAAYFSDAAFKTQYLDHVEAQVAFSGGARPVVAHAPTIICDATNMPACVTPNPTPTPALISATQNQIVGRGGVRGATVTVTEGTTTVATSAALADTGGGMFTLTPSPLLARGLHKLTATQSVAGAPSAAKTFEFDVGVPNTPATPRVTEPVATTPSGSGIVNVAGGGAAANATITVTAKLRVGDNKGTTIGTATFTADGSGNWAGTITLPPGTYDVTVTQTVAGVASNPGPGVRVDVQPPALNVTAPTNGMGVDGAVGATTALVQVSGNGAVTSLGDVIVADGDGTYFVEIAKVAPSSGSFTATVPLDFGRHVLKIFQRANGLESAGVQRVVNVRPPALAGTVIQFFKTGGVDVIATPSAVVYSEVIVHGVGAPPRIGLPGTIIFYQGSTRLGEGTISDTGGFDVPLTIIGYGPQTMTFSQTAASLSGGGPIESAKTSSTVVVRPPAPVITSPPAGAELPGSTVDPSLPVSVVVEGTAAPLADVAITANGAPQPQTANAGATGAFTITLSLAPGTYQLRAQASFTGGALGPPTDPPVVIGVGDLTPPTVSINEALPIVRASEDASGATISLMSLLHASDNSGSVSAITCSPSVAGDLKFTIGTTNVTCEAHDAAGNHGTTSFDVVVTTNEPPDLTGTGLTAEATGPEGASVTYHVGATGYTSDCAPAGTGDVRPCTNWRPSFAGLGFRPTALAVNAGTGADRGAFYAVAFAPERSFYPLITDTPIVVLRRAPNETQWQRLTSPATSSYGQIVIGAGAPPALYVPSNDPQPERRGIKISPDGGQTWLSSMDGIGIKALAQDPTDAARLHYFAWQGDQLQVDLSRTPVGIQLYETKDGWATYARADQGLPLRRVQVVAFDPVVPGRAYASLRADIGSDMQTILYRRAGNGASWEELFVPPSEDADIPVGVLAIAPKLSVCNPTTATIFAGHFVSRDAGDHWDSLPPSVGNIAGVNLSFLFDRNDPCIVYMTGSDTRKSTDGGLTFSVLPQEPLAPAGTVVQDVLEPTNFYLAFQSLGALFKSSDGLLSWAAVPAAGLPLPHLRVSDLAVDPVDPNIALLSSEGDGMFRTTDGGKQWSPANPGVNEPFPRAAGLSARHLYIDPTSRNRIFSGTEEGADRWVKSTNGGTDWAPLLSTAGVPAAGALAVDPLASGHWFSAVPSPDAFSGPLLSLRDSAGFGGVGQIVVPALPGPGSGTSPGPSGLVEAHPTRLQLATDADHTVVMSSFNFYVSEFGFDLNFFPLSKLTEGMQTLFLEGGGLTGEANVIYDNSDGTHRLFAGGAGLNLSVDTLYRVKLEDARRAPIQTLAWEPLGGAPGLDFTRLLIDPVGGGQHMFTLRASDNGLWESADGGRTWVEDSSAPSWLSQIWLSPVDGALYGTVADTPIDLQGQAFFPLGDLATGVLWKRSTTGTAPTGARVAKGDLRVSCAPARQERRWPSTTRSLRGTWWSRRPRSAACPSRARYSTSASPTSCALRRTAPTRRASRFRWWCRRPDRRSRHRSSPSRPNPWRRPAPRARRWSSPRRARPTRRPRSCAHPPWGRSSRSASSR